MDNEMNLRFNNSLLVAIVSQCFRQIGLVAFEDFYLSDVMGGYFPQTLPRPPLENLVRALRYLGGDNSGFNSNVFMTSSTSGGGIFNEGATFFDFIGEQAYNNIASIGKGDISASYAIIQSFLTENYPHFAYLLAHLLETEMIRILTDDSICPSVDGDGTGSKYNGGYVPEQLRMILGDLSYKFSLKYQNLGIKPPIETESYIDDKTWSEIEHFFNPDLTGLVSYFNF